jgi:dTDP-4-dehydrorhamnose reductase
MDHTVRVLVLGKTSQLGLEFKSALEACPFTKNWSAEFLSRREVNLTKVDSLRKLREIPFDILINTAAYTEVDKAEKQQQRCARINALALEEIASICARNNALLIHYSSDYVYHNELRRPLIEQDPTTPKSTYAITKLLGEKLLKALHKKYFIIRTSWLYSAHKQNFLKTMLQLAQNDKPIKVVNDQQGSPTYAADLAEGTLHMIQYYLDKNKDESLHGTYNFSNTGSTTWYGFAKEIFKHAGLAVELVPVSTDEFPRPAKRPPYSVLDSSRVSKSFQLDIPNWQDGIRRCLETINS